VTLADFVYPVEDIWFSSLYEEGGRKPDVFKRIEKISYGHLYLKKEEENQMLILSIMLMTFGFRPPSSDIGDLS
jgi:hypothetical protein